MSYLFNDQKILCLSPHPDDVEFSISGLILKSEKTQFDILLGSYGGNFDVTTGENRLEEFKKAWNDTGLKNVNLIFKNIYGKPENEAVNVLDDLLSQNYDTLIIPTGNNEDSHYYHRFFNSAALAASRSKNINIVEYKTASTLENWIPNFYVDISSVYEKKKQILSNFNSQLHRPYFQDDVFDSFHHNYNCFKRGLGCVESLKILRWYT
jgi:LmbE family N-acetylglucosaminyl deacetylase